MQYQPMEPNQNRMLNIPQKELKQKDHGTFFKVVEFGGIDDIVWYFMLLGSIDTVEVILNDTGAWLSENWKSCFEIYTGAL